MEIKNVELYYSLFDVLGSNTTDLWRSFFFCSNDFGTFKLLIVILHYLQRLTLSLF